MASEQVATSSASVLSAADPHAERVVEMEQVSGSNSEQIGENSSSIKNGETIGVPVISNSVNNPDRPPLQSGFHAHRFQISLKNGLFTNELKNELLFDLNNSLYQLPPDSFIPSFNGHGLRFGKIWFSSENEESSTWLKEKLFEINEKAVDGCKFSIEPYGLHQNKVCLNIPLILNESLSESDVLKRLHFQNPKIGICHWRILRTKLTSADYRMIICSVEDCSYNLLKNLNFKLNYGFQKVDCNPYLQKTSAKKAKKAK